MNRLLLKSSMFAAASAIALSASMFSPQPASAASCEQLKGAEAQMNQLVAAVDAKKVDPLVALSTAAAGLRALPDVNAADLAEIDKSVNELTAKKAGAAEVKAAFQRASARIGDEKQAKKC
jgi:hypothetical protein